MRMVFRVKFSSASEYFDSVEQTEAKNLCSWSGELFLEMHNGTYTTQARVRQLLLSVQSISTIAMRLVSVKCGFCYVDKAV